jgi:hypothetical protein
MEAELRKLNFGSGSARGADGLGLCRQFRIGVRLQAEGGQGHKGGQRDEGAEAAEAVGRQVVSHGRYPICSAVLSRDDEHIKVVAGQNTRIVTIALKNNT